MIREKYFELINYVSFKTGVSYHRTWKILKEYSEVLKDALKRGYTLEVEGLLTITYTTKMGDIYKNTVYGLEEQITDICERLNMLPLDVRTIVVTYLKRIYDRVKDGYQVNIKGVGYLIPHQEEDYITCVPRISPVLEKPEVADFLISTDYGNLVLTEVQGEDLRFKIDISSNLFYLDDIATSKQKEGLQLEEVDI